MTRLEKLRLTNNDVQSTQRNNDMAFFTKLLPDKMDLFLNLTYFDILNADLQKYLDDYRRNILINGIKLVKESKHNETEWQKEYTLNCAKRYTSDMLWIILQAFEYYGQMDLPNKEED